MGPGTIAGWCTASRALEFAERQGVLAWRVALINNSTHKKFYFI